MNRSRVILLTSAGSGVGAGVQQAAAASRSSYRIIGTSSIVATMRTGESVIWCPETARREPFQERILQIAATLGNCLVVPGRDEDADALAEIGPPLEAHGATLASGPAWAVSAAYDKAATARQLAPFGLPIAATVDSLADALDLANGHGWPLVVKPRHGNSSHGIRVVQQPADLRACFRPGKDIVQEFLAIGQEDRRRWDGQFVGGQDGEYSMQMLLGIRGEEIGHFCSRNTLTDGVPRLVETIADAQVSDLLQKARNAFGSLSAWGAWNLQGRCCHDRSIRVFEINARPTGLTGLRARLGFNELDLLYESLILGRSPTRSDPPKAGLLIDTATCGSGSPVSLLQGLVTE